MVDQRLPNCPQFFQLFVVICFTSFSQHGRAHRASQPLISERETAFNSALTLLSLEREPTPEGNRFTVRYTKNTDDLVFIVQDNVNTPTSPTVTEEANNVWAASFVAPIISSVSQWFIMRDSEAFFMKALRLNNSDPTPGQQSVPELPVWHFDPPSEAVYEPGEDIQVTAFIPRNSQTGELIDNVQKMFHGVDLNTMRMYLDLNDDDAFTIGRPEKLDDRLQVSITIHTSRRPMSGHLQLSTQVINTGGPLAKQIQVARSILVRPSGQSGPYPDDYLAFLDGLSQQTSPSGNELHWCSVGFECLIFCASVGGAVSGIEVKEMKGDGSLAMVPSAEEGPNSSNTARDVYWKFLAQEDSGDSNSITTFQCKATDVTHGKVATKLVDVMAAIVGSIDPTRSNVTQQDDPMDPNLKILTFRCAIRGRPLPEVIFQGVSSQPFDVTEDLPDEVVTTGPNEAVATRVVTVDAYGLAQATQRIRDGQDTSPRCVIRPSYDGQVNSHDFYQTN
ncbi:hypothetical protein RRG08_050807 [Elysia crispata]|uniref:Uncharacterized protein n=1 Tax=Elysia crispata TaxID=231223 RepID=A0AAE0YH68_9GAST|nr:hypothetical protein RRG08_050807 [Elysia crispata]